MKHVKYEERILHDGRGLWMPETTKCWAQVERDRYWILQTQLGTTVWSWPLKLMAKTRIHKSQSHISPSVTDFRSRMNIKTSTKFYPKASVYWLAKSSSSTASRVLHMAPWWSSYFCLWVSWKDGKLVMRSEHERTYIRPFGRFLMSAWFKHPYNMSDK